MTDRLDIIEVKASLGINEAGEITGQAWVFSEPDSVGDIITKGAFGSIASDLPILFQHDPTDIVGTWTEITATDDALVVKGKLHLERARARSIRASVQSELIKGLSIGFRTVKSTRDPRSGHRRLWEIDLWEISIVTFPMMDRARIAPGTAGGRKARLDRSLEAAISVFKH
ncbi:MAG: HK97 family phage prohead protease [Rhizobiales bacterium]|nr:HK97 family phage prohead protease [Hyphomicrobiales bacterium]